MTPENQPEKGMVKKAYGIIKTGGHSLKRIGFGDIYALIDEKADEAKQHREENFRYLNTKIDTQVGEMRQEIGQVNQRIDNLAERIDNRMDALDKKIDTQIGLLRQDIGSVRQEVGSVRQEVGSVRQEVGSVRQELSKRLDTIMQILVDIVKNK